MLVNATFDLTDVGGETDGTFVSIAAATFHQAYVPAGKGFIQNDVAVLRLNTAVPRHIIPRGEYLPLARRRSLEHRENLVWFYGYGSQLPGNRNPSMFTQREGLDRIIDCRSTSDCPYAGGLPSPFRQYVIFGPRENASIEHRCFGDSGGASCVLDSGVKTVVAVHSFSLNGCRAGGDGGMSVIAAAPFIFSQLTTTCPVSPPANGLSENEDNRLIVRHKEGSSRSNLLYFEWEGNREGLEIWSDDLDRFRNDELDIRLCLYDQGGPNGNWRLLSDSPGGLPRDIVCPKGRPCWDVDERAGGWDSRYIGFGAGGFRRFEARWRDDESRIRVKVQGKHGGIVPDFRKTEGDILVAIFVSSQHHVSTRFPRSGFEIRSYRLKAQLNF